MIDLCAMVEKKQDELGKLNRKIQNLLDFDCFEKDLEEVEGYSYVISRSKGEGMH